MATISMKALLEAGVHFGHQTRRWNPKMAKYIFGSRSNIHIIDLQKTAKELKKAYKFIRETAAEGGSILFVGTKKQAQEAIVAESQRCGAFYVSERWLGGTLTNFDTIKKSIGRLNELDKMKTDGLFRVMSKKEVSRLEKERTRLTKTLEGFKKMTELPACLFVIDPVQENTAILEARRMEVPVVAVCDTNCDPDLIDYPVPGNDDAIRSVKLFCALMADAILEGKAEAEKAATPSTATGPDTADQAASDAAIVLSEAEPATVPNPLPNNMAGSNGTPITSGQIQELREATGAGIMDCKKALEQAHGDMAKAKTWLRDRGVTIAASKGGRMAKEGLIGSYIHAGGKLGVLVELNSETDFVARTEDFQNLLRELCMQVAAAAPRWVSRDMVPPSIIEEKRQEFEKEAIKEQKPAPVAAKIAEGRLDKYLSETCLLEQLYVRDPAGKTKIKDLVTQAVGKMGENVVVRRFVRFQVGGE